MHRELHTQRLGALPAQPGHGPAGVRLFAWPQTPGRGVVRRFSFFCSDGGDVVYGGFCAWVIVFNVESHVQRNRQNVTTTNPPPPHHVSVAPTHHPSPASRADSSPRLKEAAAWFKVHAIARRCGLLGSTPVGTPGCACPPLAWLPASIYKGPWTGDSAGRRESESEFNCDAKHDKRRKADTATAGR